MAEPFLGEIRMFAGNFAPRGWAFCDGQLLSIAQNAALFSLLGTTYGGDGRVNFGLPDLRGRVPMGFGQGPGLSPRMLGERAGAESVTLLSAQMPPHAHERPCQPAQATERAPGVGLAPATSRADTYGDLPAASTPSRTTPTGQALPHDNLGPSLAVDFIIALQGIFPARP